MVERLLRNIQRIVAPNPGPLTHHGTNTYIVGRDPCVVIDPGPANTDHLKAILTAAGRVEAIVLTHSHIDHSELVPDLKHASGAPVFAYGDSYAGRDALPDLGPSFTEGGGTDQDFQPDILIHDKQVLEFSNISLTCHWTPGHFPNHMCFAMDDVLFSGDLVMGWSTSLVSVPEGSISQFITSCEKIAKEPQLTYLPGHGDQIANGPARARELVHHRISRETQVLGALDVANGTAMDLATCIYTDIPAHLIPAAARNVLAHLVDLTQRGLVIPCRQISPDAIFMKNPDLSTGRP